MSEYNQNSLNSQLNPTQTPDQLKEKELDQKIMELSHQGLSFAFFKISLINSQCYQKNRLFLAI